MGGEAALVEAEVGGELVAKAAKAGEARAQVRASRAVKRVVGWAGEAMAAVAS